MKMLKRLTGSPRLMFVLTLAVVVTLALVGCAPTKGVVVGKEYDDADRYWTTCYTTEYRYVPVASTVNGKTTTRMQRQSYQQPYSCQKHDPEHYSLFLQDGKLQGWREVNAAVYAGCKTGNVYRDGRCR